MLETLVPGSSPVDWCEENYGFSPSIAEFVNTFSNILFFVLPPVMIHLFQEYGKVVHRGVHLIWLQLIAVGVFSAYFHATLSMMGQLLDELSILWVVMLGFAVWYPSRFLPQTFRKDRRQFNQLILLVSIVASIMCFLQPIINAFALMTLTVPTLALLFIELSRCENRRAKSLAFRSMLVWIAAFSCWISDRFFCEVWSRLRFPYLHGAWHILIFLSSYTVNVLFAYFYAVNEAPERLPVLMYWPTDNFEYGIPYVALKAPKKVDEKHSI